MRRQDDGSDGGREEGEVRVGALGGEGGAVWAVRLASSLVFVFVFVVVLRCSMCWVVTERQKRQNSAASSRVKMAQQHSNT